MTNLLILILLGLYALSLSFIFDLGFAWSQEKDLPIVSTRDHFNLTTGELLLGHNETDYDISHIPGTANGSCPEEMAIFVHGWGNTKESANERLDRVNMSLSKNDYRFPVVGYSWDSNTTPQQDKAGWTIANLIAKDNGPKLAQFVLDYKNKCKNDDGNDVKIRLIAHSLGSRVVLSSLDSLFFNSEWRHENYSLTSVDLLGAAVDNEEISKDPLYIVNDISLVNDSSEWYDVYGIKSSYGKAAEKVVTSFSNLYSPKDTTLMIVYGNTEHDNALGLTGAQENITPLSNYEELNVQKEILAICDADADGKSDFLPAKNLTIDRGYNHGGYIGFRNNTDTTKLLDDGSIDVVVDNWENIPHKVAQEMESSVVCN